MNKVCRVLVLLLAVAMPVWSAEYMGALEGPSPQMTETVHHSTPGVGASLLAFLVNIVYCPVRFMITAVTAEIGGFTGWMTGGDEAAAQAVWESTDGQAYVRPEMLEGRDSGRG